MANVKHAVFESSDIHATRAGHILNFVHTEDCDNGTIWAKGTQVEGRNNIEIYNAEAATATSKVYVVGSVPLLPRARTKAENAECNFVNEAGEVMRMYALEADDRYRVSIMLVKALADEPVVGNYIVADIAKPGFYEEKAADDGASAFVAVIRDIRTYGFGASNDKRILLEVVKNG